MSETGAHKLQVSVVSADHEVWAGTAGLGILAALATAVLRNHPLAPFLRGLILAATVVGLAGLFVIDIFIGVFAGDC